MMFKMSNLSCSKKKKSNLLVASGRIMSCKLRPVAEDGDMHTVVIKQIDCLEKTISLYPFKTNYLFATKEQALYSYYQIKSQNTQVLFE